MNRLLVDIVADPVCPWCYIGLHSFETAAGIIADEFDVLPRFRAYQLNPDTPREGADRRAHYARKFPDADVRNQMRRQLIEAARGAGTEFDPGKPTLLPNTLDVHRVSRWSHFDGLQLKFAHIAYDAFWRRGVDLGDRDALARLAGEAGMAANRVRDRLASDEDRRTVADEAAAMRGAGVSGVPTFIVNEHTGFSGALPPHELATALKRAARTPPISP